MAHVVINNCYLICKKKCTELASDDAFNVTIAMRNIFSTYQEKVTRLITISGLYKHMYCPNSVSSKFS